MMKSIEDIVTDYLDLPSKDVVLTDEFEEYVTKAIQGYVEDHIDEMVASEWAIGSDVARYVLKQVDDYLDAVTADSFGTIAVSVASKPKSSMPTCDFDNLVETFPAWQLDLYEVARRRGHTKTESQLGKMCPEKIHDMWTHLPNYVFETEDGKRARGNWD